MDVIVSVCWSLADTFKPNTWRETFDILDDDDDNANQKSKAAAAAAAMMIHQISVDTFTHHEDYAFLQFRFYLLRKEPPQYYNQHMCVSILSLPLPSSRSTCGKKSFDGNEKPI